MLALEEPKNIGNLNPMIVAEDTVENEQYELAIFPDDEETSTENPGLHADLNKKRKASMANLSDDEGQVRDVDSSANYERKG